MPEKISPELEELLRRFVQGDPNPIATVDARLERTQKRVTWVRDVAVVGISLFLLGAQASAFARNYVTIEGFKPTLDKLESIQRKQEEILLAIARITTHLDDIDRSAVVDRNDLATLRSNTEQLKTHLISARNR